MGYPVIESIRSLLPLVDEFVIGLGQSDDGTRQLIESLESPKIRIVDTIWDTSKTKGGLILSEKTNEALAHCAHDWCFYIQADEVIHQDDLTEIRNSVEAAQSLTASGQEIDGLLFHYTHFYGSYSTVAQSRRWYRNEVRVVRRSSGIQSHADAQGFRVAGAKPRVLRTAARVFHYGWVKPPKMMGQKSKLLNRWWHGNKRDHQFENFEYAKQYGLRPFVGTHPDVMKEQVAAQDWTFKTERSLSDWSLKDLNLLASDTLERITGYRIGEYKPYRIVRR